MWPSRFGFNSRGWDDFKKYALKARDAEKLEDLEYLMAHVCCDVFSRMRNPPCFEPCFKDVTQFWVEMHQNNHRQIYVSSNKLFGKVLSIIELGWKGVGSNWLATRHGRQV